VAFSGSNFRWQADHIKNCHSLRLSDSRRTLKDHRLLLVPASRQVSRQRGEAGKAALCRSGAKFPVDGNAVSQDLEAE